MIIFASWEAFSFIIFRRCKLKIFINLTGCGSTWKSDDYWIINSDSDKRYEEVVLIPFSFYWYGSLVSESR